MNHSKLEVVKQEMARVNIDILGIRELKWTGMAEFNSDDHYIYYCGQESLTNYGWRFMTLYRRQGSRPYPRKRNSKRQNGCLRRPYNSCEKKRSKKQRRKGKIYPSDGRVPKNSKEK